MCQAAPATAGRCNAFNCRDYVEGRRSAPGSGDRGRLSIIEQPAAFPARHSTRAMELEARDDPAGDRLRNGFPFGLRARASAAIEPAPRRPARGLAGRARPLAWRGAGPGLPRLAVGGRLTTARSRGFGHRGRDRGARDRAYLAHARDTPFRRGRGCPLDAASADAADGGVERRAAPGVGARRGGLYARAARPHARSRGRASSDAQRRL